MAEQVTTQDISTVKEQNSGNLISRAGNMFDKFQKFIRNFIKFSLF